MPPPPSSSDPVGPSDIEKIRNKIDTAFKEYAGLIGSARRPLPDRSGNGTYLQYKDDSPDLLQKINAGLKDLSSLGITDVATLLQVQGKQRNHELWDDKQYLMERLIQTAAKFPDDSATGKKVTDGFLSSLYNDLQHPPISYLGKKFFYRNADGSYNSLLHPDLGKAETPYARTVAPKTMQPGALPDSGDVFDAIMARKHRIKHPNQISSVLFYLASIIIHDLFRTDHENFFNSKTSSYLDLSPLYGSSDAEVAAMRTKKDGKIKDDCFSEGRLLLFPPGVGALLILFNRFHNSVAEHLAKINQNGAFTLPKETDPEQKSIDYDEDLFQTARLITCGLYINIILTDYVRTILNLNKTNSNWNLDPRADIKDLPVAAGNQVSAEFNLVYRWHSTISERDEKWTVDLWKKLFPKYADNIEQVPFHDFFDKAKEEEKKVLTTPPEKREFGGLKRVDGKFSDDDLAEILASSIDDCANSYGANRVPVVMRTVEILGMEQARRWSVASLNEFRKYFGLAPHKTFESINSDPYVAEQLRHLYDHPDYVELYPGLVAEEPKVPMTPGAGLTPSFTVSRAVLSDAVALVRGDRFYTVDYHPKKLTNWGFSEAATDISINNGGVFYKLFLHGLPNHFKPNSVYAHYPMTVPEEMEKVLGILERKQNYDFTRPKRLSGVKVVSSYESVTTILGSTEAFKINTPESLEFLLGSAAKSFVATGLKKVEVSTDPKWISTVRKFYETTTANLLKRKSYKIALKKNTVDIIRDIGNLVPVHFAAELFGLPLKTAERPLGIFTEHELYLINAAIFTTVFFDVDPVNSFPLRLKTKSATKILGDLVHANVTELTLGGILSRVISAVFGQEISEVREHGIELIKKLVKQGLDPKELVWGHILGQSGGLVAQQGQLFAQIIEFYLNKDNEVHLKAINKLAKEDTDTAFKQLEKYILEGARLAGEPGVYRVVNQAVEIKDGDRHLKLAANDKVLLNIPAAARDAKAFPNPDVVDVNRKLEAYAGLATRNSPFGDVVTRTALTAMLKVVGKLDNLRPAKGNQGKVYKVAAPFPEPGVQPTGPWYHVYLTESHDRLWPFPQTLRVNWD